MSMVNNKADTYRNVESSNKTKKLVYEYFRVLNQLSDWIHLITCNPMIHIDFGEIRLLLRTFIHDKRTTRVEVATCWGILGTWDFTL